MWWRAKGGHSFASPPIGAASQKTVAAEGAGQQIIRAHSGEHAIASVMSFAVWLLLCPRRRPDNRNSSVDAAFPMNDEKDFAGVRLHVDHDFHGSRFQPDVS